MLKGLLFRLLPALLVFGGFELSLRALDLPDFDACWFVKEDFWQPEPDPELGWLYIPGSEVVGAIINERGLRGPVLPERKPAGHTRLLFIGDSTAFGLGVSLENSFAAIATSMVQDDRPDQTVEYEMGALPGYSSHHSRVLTRRMLAQQPDYVVFYVGGHNDHSRGRYYSDGDIPARLARRERAWHSVRTLLLVENMVDRSYRSFFRKLRSESGKARVSPDDFRDNLREMMERTLAASATPILLSPPFSGHMLEDHEGIPDYQAALAEVARETGVPFVDLQPLFQEREERDVYLKDLFHFEVLGHRIAAKQIHRLIREAGA